MNTPTVAVGIVDAQRGFMPEVANRRAGQPGLEELPVNNGDRVIEPINKLLGAAVLKSLVRFTTQDWHPEETAHFDKNPNFKTTWPVHCVANTPGAEIHPEVQVPAGTVSIKKGDEVLVRGEDDTSYSGANGHNDTGELLGNVLRERGVTEVVLGGLALDYCVKATAIDLKKQGFDVFVAMDATAAVAKETGYDAIHELEKAGITLTTTAQYLQRLEQMAEAV